MTDPQARSPGPHRVHVVDDDEEVRWAIETLMMSAGLNVETHASAKAFLEVVLRPAGAEAAIGCVLTDVRMSEMDGLELLSRLRQIGFRRPVIVMTAHGDISMAVRTMKSGAFDFIEKPFDDGALIAMVKAALEEPDGGMLAGPMQPDAPTPARARQDARSIEAARRIATLSPREREVLDLATDGKPSKVIAAELGISVRTVEVHRVRLMARLEVRSLAEAVRLAVWAEQA